MTRQNDQREPLKILFLSAEAAPLAKVGGLGDVSEALPCALRNLSSPVWDGPRIDVRLVLPFHDEINKKIREPRFVASFLVNHPGEPLPAKAFETSIDDLPVYLIEGPPIPPEEPIYSRDPLKDGEKYTFFSLAAIELISHLNWIPDIIHANDWHTSVSLYILNYLKKKNDLYSSIRSILTVHNLPYMGKDSEEAMLRYGIPRSKDKRLPAWATLFPLPLGLSTADQIVAVSPGYAQEIMTPEFGCGLQDFLMTRKESVKGIVNGLNTDRWNPQTDLALTQQFNHQSINLRSNNKKTLEHDLGFPEDEKIPLLIIVSRLDQQKGIDIAIAGLRACAELDWQAVILGSGDPLLESACRSLEAEFPEKVRVLIRFDNDISRRMYGSGDILLMPSRYEPCGLTQMIAMRYGCLPLARATGGLKDTIVDSTTSQKPTGFLFPDASPESFSEGLIHALNVFSDKEVWQDMQIRAMQVDNSWQKPALEYANLYRRLKEQKL